MEERLVEVSMAIIMDAGDARAACKEALDAAAAADYEKAQEKLKEAHEKIAAAHAKQTDEIQGEVRGEKREYSLLFAHAQDTMMTVNSEINIAKQLLKICESYEMRIRAVEEACGMKEKEQQEEKS